MCYRRPGFLAAVWLGSSPPSRRLVFLFLFLSLPVCRQPSLVTGEGGEGRGNVSNHTTARKPGPQQIMHYSLARVNASHQLIFTDPCGLCQLKNSKFFFKLSFLRLGFYSVWYSLRRSCILDWSQLITSSFFLSFLLGTYLLVYLCRHAPWSR
jgi:hypothetical protein